MKNTAIGLVVGLMVFAVVMLIGWMHGLDFSARDKWTGLTAFFAVVVGVGLGGFAAFVSSVNEP